VSLATGDLRHLKLANITSATGNQSTVVGDSLDSVVHGDGCNGDSERVGSWTVVPALGQPQLAAGG
jgi:hypothetical protein